MADCDLDVLPALNFYSQLTHLCIAGNHLPVILGTYCDKQPCVAQDYVYDLKVQFPNANLRGRLFLLAFKQALLMNVQHPQLQFSCPPDAGAARHHLLPRKPSQLSSRFTAGGRACGHHGVAALSRHLRHQPDARAAHQRQLFMGAPGTAVSEFGACVLPAGGEPAACRGSRDRAGAAGDAAPALAPQ